MNISAEQAKALVEETVSSLGAVCGDEFGLMNDKTITANEGWVFFYNSKDFIETGDPRDALAGNGPIFVDRNGVVRELPSAIPWEIAIRSS
jgi:hypothetical protein